MKRLIILFMILVFLILLTACELDPFANSELDKDLIGSWRKYEYFLTNDGYRFNEDGSFDDLTFEGSGDAVSTLIRATRWGTRGEELILQWLPNDYATSIYTYSLSEDKTELTLTYKGGEPTVYIFCPLADYSDTAIID